LLISEFKRADGMFGMVQVYNFHENDFNNSLLTPSFLVEV
jgi:hypothetical protein